MSKEIKIAGSISFGGKRLNVYGDLDAPLFKAKDISHAIGYSSGNEWRMLEMCEEDEKLKLPLVVAGQRRSVNFVTENVLIRNLDHISTRNRDRLHKLTGFLIEVNVIHCAIPLFELLSDVSAFFLTHVDKLIMNHTSPGSCNFHTALSKDIV